MGYSYDLRRRTAGRKESKEVTPSGTDKAALASGLVRPSAADKGSGIDLNAELRGRMENAFGDLSGVKLYRSRAVADAGANAIAMGNEIAFAPGKDDFSSRAGQELLGHELSHVALQRSGAVRGSGFLDSPALEARADREGAMAAAGRQVYGGAAAPLSTASAASAAGPMQASKHKEEKNAQVQQMQDIGLTHNINYAIEGSDAYNSPETAAWSKEKRTVNGNKQKYKVHKNLDYSEIDEDTLDDGVREYAHQDEQTQIFASNMMKANKYKKPEGREKLLDRLNAKYSGPGYKEGVFQGHLSRPKSRGETEDVHIRGLNYGRLLPTFLSDRGRGFKMSDKAVEAFMDKLMAPHKLNKTGTDEDGNDKYEEMSEDEQQTANAQFDEGMQQLKGVFSGDLKAMEKNYGAMLSQLHPEDLMPQLNARGMEFHTLYHSAQDIDQFRIDGQRYFKQDNGDAENLSPEEQTAIEKDKEFQKLSEYYYKSGNLLTKYAEGKQYEGHKDEYGAQELSKEDMAEGENSLGYSIDTGEVFGNNGKNIKLELPEDRGVEASLNGPKLSPEEEAKYLEKLHSRATKGGWLGRLFGRFKKPKK